MIHIATVHWHTDKWIDLQLSYLKQNISTEFKVYAFLNGIDRQHYCKFDYVCDEPVSDHGTKLNLLSRFISLQASSQDILIFLDGDAFPIAPVESYLAFTLSNFPLCAVVRAENLSDQQPHPSFCATTVGFWEQIQGDWKKGYCWRDRQGSLVSDIGGNLLKQLLDHNTIWKALLRSHSLGNHGLWYGVYDGFVYHHGAGFRDPFSRLDIANGPVWIRYFQLALSKSRSLQVHIERTWKKIAAKQLVNQQLQEHDGLYHEITANKAFFNYLLPKDAKSAARTNQE